MGNSVHYLERIIEILKNFDYQCLCVQTLIEDVRLTSDDSLNKRNKTFEFTSNLLSEFLKDESQDKFIAKDYESFQISREEANNLLNSLSDKLFATMDYKKILFRMSFIYLISIFDSAIIDLVRELYKKDYRVLIKSNKNLNYEQILNFENINDLKEYILEKELLEFSYKSIKDQIKYISQEFKLEIILTTEQLSNLIEIRETRNILVHNNGKVNEVYLRNTKNNNLKIGDERLVDSYYLNESKHLLRDFLNSILQSDFKKIKMSNNKI